MSSVMHESWHLNYLIQDDPILSENVLNYKKLCKHTIKAVLLN